MLLLFCIVGYMDMHKRGVWDLHQGFNYLHWTASPMADTRSAYGLVGNTDSF